MALDPRHRQVVLNIMATEADGEERAMTRTILWKPDRWDWRDKHRIVWVSVAKLDALWREDPVLWLPPGSGTSW